MINCWLYTEVCLQQKILLEYAQRSNCLVQYFELQRYFLLFECQLWLLHQTEHLLTEVYFEALQIFYLVSKN